MITKAKNKAMSVNQIETKGQLEKYHFPGELKFKPVTIEASSQAEAQEKWEEEKEEN